MFHSLLQLRLLTTTWGGHGRAAGTWDFLSAIFGNCVFLLFISWFWIPPPSSCHSSAAKMKSCPWCVHNNGSLRRPHGSCSLIYFNSFYIEPNDLIYLFLMESLQPSPPFQRNDELSCYWNLFPAQCPCHSPGEGGTPPATALILLETPESWDQSAAGITFLFLLFSPVHKLFSPCIPAWVSYPFLVPLFSRLVRNLGKSGIILSNFQSSLILWRNCLQRSWVSEFLRLGELWLVVSS